MKRSEFDALMAASPPATQAAGKRALAGHVAGCLCVHCHKERGRLERWSEEYGGKPKKPAIRIPSRRLPNVTELLYCDILADEFPDALIKYEAITFKLPGGNYTPDWTVWRGVELILIVECKGSYRLGSAGAAHRAFKEAAAAWSQVAFRYAKKNKDGRWEETNVNS